MAQEIERKFKVFMERLPLLQRGQLIKQGYLQADPQIRFRIVEDKVILGIKLFRPDGSRFELETEKSFPSAEEIGILCSLALHGIIEKTRYVVPYAGLNWEIDVYGGKNAGLVTAEVELPAMDWKIAFPPWIDQDHELTRDYSYSNFALAEHPYGDWADKSKN